MICRSIRDFAVGLASWLLAGTATAASLEVRSPSARLIQTAPGQIVTSSVVVANRGAQADDFSEVLTLPAGFTRIAPIEAPFRLLEGEQGVRVVALGVLANTPSGKYTIRYRVNGRLDPSASDETDFTVQITAVNKLEFTVEPRPDPVFAGDAYPIRATVTNRGNSPLPVRIAAKSSLGLPFKASPLGFTLPAGGSQEIVGEVKTDPNLPRRASHALSFQLHANAGQEVLTASGAAVAELIPLISGERDQYHRLPMQFRSTAIFESGHDPKMQLELSGAGTLDEAGKKRVDFIFRGPDLDHNSMFAQRDEYGISLHGPTWGVDLGDRAFELSPLTEKRAFGRGLGITYRNGEYQAGAFYMRSRHRSENVEELGAYLRKHFGPRVSFQANYLRKWGGGGFTARALPQNIFSLEGRYQHGKQLDLRLEYGVSLSDSGLVDQGYRVEARGALGDLNYVLEHAHAGANFFGYYNDTDNTTLSLAKPITAALHANVSLNRYAGNLEQNPDRSSVVNRENSWEAGLRYEVSKRTELTAQLRHVEREDILAPAAYNFREDSVRLGGAHNFGKLQMRSFVDFGTLDNDLTGENGAFQRYSVFASYQPTPRQRYSVYGTYGPSAFSGSREHSLNLGLSADWRVNDNFSFNINYARNEFDGLTGREQDQVMARARYRFDNHDEISFAGRWSHSSGRDGRTEAGMMLTFTRPFGVPVSRKTSAGSLTGRIAVAGQPIRRAVVKAGESYAVTDSEGNFQFASLKPGEHDLKVVSDSLGSNVVMGATTPLKVRVRGAKTTQVALDAIRAASVRVRVQRYAFGPGDSLIPAGGEGGVPVQASHASDRIVVQTDRTGVVTFERLLAGPWKLQVSEENLPPHHRMENPEREIQLEPGEAAEVIVRLLPVKRKIQMIDSGSLR